MCPHILNSAQFYVATAITKMPCVANFKQAKLSHRVFWHWQKSFFLTIPLGKNRGEEQSAGIIYIIASATLIIVQNYTLFGPVQQRSNSRLCVRFIKNVRKILLIIASLCWDRAFLVSVPRSPSFTPILWPPSCRPVTWQADKPVGGASWWRHHRQAGIMCMGWSWGRYCCFHQRSDSWLTRSRSPEIKAIIFYFV